MAGPSLPTIKKLFALSGNRCAFRGCTQALITAGTPTGEICHIRAQAAGGPRYDAAQTDAQRHAEANLIILCPGHHKVVDSDVATYTVAALLKMKADHESAATNQGQLTDEEATEFLVQLRLNVIASVNQSGGQTAHQIVNVYSPPAAPAAPSPQLWVNEKALSLHYSLLKSPPPAFVDFTATPASPIAPSARLSATQLTDAMIRSRVEYAIGFPFATDDPIERHQSPSGIFIARTLNLAGYVETWSAFGTGFFRLTRVPPEDLQRQAVGGKQPTEFLDWLWAIATIGEALVFSLRFLDKFGVEGDFDYELQFHGMRDRVLRDRRGAVHFNYQCNTEAITIRRTANVSAIKNDPTEEGIAVAKELFTMFHFDRLGDDTLRDWFQKLWKKQL